MDQAIWRALRTSQGVGIQQKLVEDCSSLISLAVINMLPFESFNQPLSYSPLTENNTIQSCECPVVNIHANKNSVGMNL